MAKSPDAFRTISEVADWLGVQAHVLRFWESKFTQVKPVKRAGGRRYYRPSDMQLLGGIKTLLHDDGLTIKGVQKILREQGVAHVAALSPPLEDRLEAVEPAIRATVLEFKGKPAAPAAVPAPQPEPHSQIKMDLGPEPDKAAPETETGGLPSFLHRPEGSQPADTAPEPVAAAPSPSGPHPRVVDAPDPPSEGGLPYTPGPLGRLAGLTALSAEQAARIAPLARELRLWHDRNTQAGTG